MTQPPDQLDPQSQKWGARNFGFLLLNLLALYLPSVPLLLYFPPQVDKMVYPLAPVILLFEHVEAHMEYSVIHDVIWLAAR